MKRLTWILAALGISMLACGPIDLAREILGRLATATPASEFHDSAVWYVAPDGDDANSCAVPTAACRTVQAAIDKADDDDVIEIAPGTYVERFTGASAGIFIEGKDLSLRGAGSEVTFLETDISGRAIVVIRDADVSLSRLTIQGGFGAGGVGINATDLDLRLSDTVVQDNEGIGIMVSGLGMTFEFTNVTLRRNGGGLFSGGVGTLHASQVTANEGIGIHNGGVLTVSETTIVGNRAENGPGITNNYGGNLTFEQSTLANNTVTAATHSRALGISNNGTMTLRNSTVSSNGIVAGGSGSAIATMGDLTLVYTTVSGNDGGGIAGWAGSITFDNALIADNNGLDCGITATENHFVGVTLDSDETCLRFFSSERTTHSLSIGPLADNGGVTETHALLPGSPAIDAASGDCPGVDQRGISRPTGTGCDVGAFEFDALTSATPISQEGTPLPPPITVTPTAQSLPTISKDALCWKGPGSLYEVISSVNAGTQVMLLGRGLVGEWWIIDSPRYPGVVCWLPEDTLDVDPTLDLSGLPLIKAPLLPTPTATPITGCLYKGPNDPQAVCYAIDVCPVPFDQTQGACSP
ncbi:MAG: right-handed parallel beta-helix repeat-containing protein [Anaerolineales bacterium]